jgi:hypothetical protein
MALPRKKTDFTLNPVKIGTEYLKYGFDRIEQLMQRTDQKTNYLPRTIKLRDLDAAFIDYVKNKDMKLILDGKEVPAFLLSKERWGEFAKTWQFVDNDKNILTPFITIKRTKKELGTRVGKRYIVPQPRTFTYIDVPIIDEGEVINLRFKVPEPTFVDMYYEVRLFTKYQENANIYDEQILNLFASRQAYCWIKGTPFAIHLEETNEDNVQDIKGDRMKVSVFQIKLLGFIQNEKKFQIVKTTRLPKLSVTLKNTVNIPALVSGTFDNTFDGTFG